MSLAATENTTLFLNYFSSLSDTIAILPPRMSQLFTYY
jgi:hypothetical protein